jgi:hypothetical protein
MAQYVVIVNSLSNFFSRLFIGYCNEHQTQHSTDNNWRFVNGYIYV